MLYLRKIAKLAWDMRKFILTIFAVTFLSVFSVAAHAQILSRFSNSSADWDKAVEHTKKGEQEGKTLWDKLQSKQTQCINLSDDDFDALGEYFMGQMMGGSHPAMNQMMVNMMGEEGEKQMHIAMGKRLSGCDTAAALPSQGVGFMPMMQMMRGGRSSPFGFNPTNTMIGFGYGFGFFGWILMVLGWVLIIVTFVALTKWLTGQFRGGTSRNNALDILKERYARGDIDKKEFEEKKTELIS